MTTPESIGVYTPNDAREIKRRVLGTGRALKGQLTYGEKDDQGWHYCKLKEALAVATDPETGYTQADAAVLMYVEGDDSLDMEEVVDADDYITVTNRSLTFSAEIDDVIAVRWNEREWIPVVSGGGSNIANECPCQCLENGDTTVEGIPVTSRVDVTFNPETFNVTNGRVTFEGGTISLIMTYDGIWEADIGAYLTSVFTDGSDATAYSTLDGDITLEWTPGTAAVLTLCVTADIPESSA
jgi:hypothetical protein